MAAGARLVELDLSDNAFGPVGIQAIFQLLTSPACHTLRVLKLNNTGIGVGGGEVGNWREVLGDWMCHSVLQLIIWYVPPLSSSSLQMPSVSAMTRHVVTEADYNWRCLC